MKKLHVLIGLFLLSLTDFAQAKVLIITHAYNRPDFLEMQIKTLQKFIEDDYEFVVFNDCPPEKPLHGKIIKVCEKGGVRCIPIPQNIHNRPEPVPFWQEEQATGTRRHVDGIKYSLEVMGYKHDDILVFIDSDLFIIAPVNIHELCKDYDIVSIMRLSLHRVPGTDHLWPGLSMLHMDTLPDKEKLNFGNGIINGNLVDTGGYTYNYLKKHPNIRLKPLGYFPIARWEYNKSLEKKIQIMESNNYPSYVREWVLKFPQVELELYCDGRVVHHGGGRNDKIQIKHLQLFDLLNAALQN